MKIGTMTLNKVPDNYFDYTEQSAFCPCAMVPGIEASPDRMLQGRLFAYADTQRYRVGPNYLQLPVNRPLVPVSNNHSDGAMQSVARTGDVNYEPTSAANTPAEQPQYRYSEYPVSGLTPQRAKEKQVYVRKDDMLSSSLAKQ